MVRIYILIVVGLFSACFLQAKASTMDSLRISYYDNNATCINNSANDINIKIDNADVTIYSRQQRSIVISLEGETNNGSLCIDSDRPCTLLLNDIKMISPKSPAIRSLGNNPLNIILEEYSENTISDGTCLYEDIMGVSPACISVQGSMRIEGKGKLIVDASANHGIQCRQNMTIDDGNISVTTQRNDGYCIKADEDIDIRGGSIILSTTGNGRFTKSTGDSFKYTTARCLHSDKEIRILSGDISCESTGVGGKGITAKYNIIIGLPNTPIPHINVTTRGYCLEENKEKDTRNGSPKAISSRRDVIINCGKININTFGMGGEGIEGRKTVAIHGGEIECATYDDGINSGQTFLMDGGSLYCCSATNDGIDSNGSVTISGGEILSISKEEFNEAVDAEDDKRYITGGILFGIGNDYMRIGYSECPIYNTEPRKISHGVATSSDYKQPLSGIEITEDEYLHLVCNGKILMSALNQDCSNNAFLLLVHPDLREGGEASLFSGNEAIKPERSIFNGKLTFGGSLPKNAKKILNCESRIKKN